MSQFIWTRIIAILYILNTLSPPTTISFVLIIILWSGSEKWYKLQFLHEKTEAQWEEKNRSGSHGEIENIKLIHFKNSITGHMPCFFNTLQSCSYKCSKKNFGIFALYNYSRRHKCPVNTFDSATMQTGSQDFQGRPPTHRVSRDLAGQGPVLGLPVTHGARWRLHQQKVNDVGGWANATLNHVPSPFRSCFQSLWFHQRGSPSLEIITLSHLPQNSKAC